jgi:uncharacterized membrane protein (DUF4010 family)
LWELVLLLSGLNFAGHLARRLLGADQGYRITGLLGGLVSSTAVTVTYARLSKSESGLGRSLGQGVIGACVVLIPRVLIVSALLNADVARSVVLLLLPSAVIGAGILTVMWIRSPADHHGVPEPARSPLDLWTAIRMAVLFQLAISLLAFVSERAGAKGVYGAAAALGLTDVDALTVSMSRTAAQVTTQVAARAIAIGIISNTVLKLGVAGFVGKGRFRRVTFIGLGGLLLGSLIGLVIA